MKVFYSVVTVAFMFAVTAVAAQFETFKDGDTVCFVGDSITHGGGYPAYIMEYYVTRFPKAKINFLNKGISGDSAHGGVKRYEWDILADKPNKASIMMGMNDVGRSLYGVENPDTKRLENRKKRLDNHKLQMEKLIALLEKNGSEVILITPSIYDQTAEIEKQNLYGVNDALGVCADYCREQAANGKRGLVDFHKPMTELNAQYQKDDAKKTIVGRDRVHPGNLGHMIMAYLFLKDQNAPGLVASVDIDDKNAKVLSEKNCSVTHVVKGDDAITFDYLAKALPWPVAKPYKDVDKLVPLTKDFNQEIIKIQNLPAGEYKLLIDGKEVTKADAKAFANGVNIATLATPQQKQAEKIHKLVMKKRSLEGKLRNIIKVNINLMNKKIDPKDTDAVKKYCEDFIKNGQKRHAYGYYKHLYGAYIKEGRPSESELKEQIDTVKAQIHLESEPSVHAMKVVKL